VPEKTEPIRTGSRDDLRLEASRCLRIRFSASQCDHCSAICPKEAVSLEDGLVIDSNCCSGCLLCTSVCPSGALEFSADVLACLAQLSKVTEPVLGCCRTKERANGWIACLGGLSSEHLLTLKQRLTGQLTLNISLCSACPNSAMLRQLQRRLQDLAALLPTGCNIIMAESVETIRFQEETVDRRSFFKSFRSSLFQTAAVVLSQSSEQTEKRSDYTSKRLPARRELLNRVLETTGQATTETLQKRFFGNICISENCTACQGCVAICPTGALSTKEEQADTPPAFETARCTACGLCVEFCLDEAIILH